MYSLKSGEGSGAIARVLGRPIRDVLALVFRGHDKGLHVDLWLRHELAEGLEARGGVDRRVGSHGRERTMDW